MLRGLRASVVILLSSAALTALRNVLASLGALFRGEDLIDLLLNRDVPRQRL